MILPSLIRSVLATIVTSAVLHAADVRPNMLLLDGVVAGPVIVAVGERGTILNSADDGHTWQSADVAAAATLTGVSFADGTKEGWAVGHDALILVTHNAGRSWRKQWQGENLQDSFLDVLALDAQHIIAVGAYGLFVSSDNGGQTWTRRHISDDDFHFNRITRGPTGSLYLAGERGTLLRSHDSGAHWDRIDSPYDGSFYGILPLDKSTLIAYGLRGRIFRSTDDGATWVPVANELRALLATATVMKNGSILFAGQSRAWLISRDGGKTVAPWPSTLASAVAELIPLADGTMLALGEAGSSMMAQP
ncbi:MAG: hypothetical protein JWM35_762 [Verrucomicrobia bacterium]|nr:hypothetical protein [Verrucomicrobiota bacterium]